MGFEWGVGTCTPPALAQYSCGFPKIEWGLSKKLSKNYRHAEAMLLHTEGMSINAEALPLQNKPYAFAVEKHSFYGLKGILLQAKTCPFMI